jgi:hypothetical protein
MSTENTTAVQPYDPARLMDAVRDRIKAEFVGLIPEDAWRQMVDAEIKRFFARTTVQTNYGRDTETRPSPFESLVAEMMRERSKELVRQALEAQWDNTTQEHASPLLAECLAKYGQDIFAATFRGMFENALAGIRNNLR